MVIFDCFVSMEFSCTLIQVLEEGRSIQDVITRIFLFEKKTFNGKMLKKNLEMTAFFFSSPVASPVGLFFSLNNLSTF